MSGLCITTSSLCRLYNIAACQTVSVSKEDVRFLPASFQVYLECFSDAVTFPLTSRLVSVFPLSNFRFVRRFFSFMPQILTAHFRSNCQWTPILEDVGCFLITYKTVPAYPLTFIWTNVLCSVSAIYRSTYSP